MLSPVMAIFQQEDFKGASDPLWQANPKEIASRTFSPPVPPLLSLDQVQIFHNAQRDITFKLRACCRTRVRSNVEDNSRP